MIEKKNKYWVQLKTGGEWVIACYAGLTVNIMRANGAVETKTTNDFLEELEYNGPEIVEPMWGLVGGISKARNDELDVCTVDEASEDTALREPEVATRREPYIIKDFVPVHGRRPNDCGVVCVANVFSRSYNDAKLLCFHAGWSSTRGITVGMVEMIAEKIGFDVTYRDDLTRGAVCDFYAEGTYIMHVVGHVIPVVNGKPYNVLGHKGSAIKSVYEVHPKIVESK